MSARIPITDPLSILWLDWCEAEHLPANTVARRRATLRSVGHAGSMTREEVEAWWATRRDLAPASRSNDLANLRSFYRWAIRWEHRPDDPTVRLDAPKVDKGLPRPVSRADLATLLRVLPDDLGRAVALGAYAGLRVAEVAALHWSEVDIEARRARVHGKGGKWRTVAIGTLLIDRLLPDTGGNVVTGTATAYTAATLQRRVNRAIYRAGVDATFHQLRHRYGTLAYQATRDLVAVGRQMGHSSPVSTAIYAAASYVVADQIAEAVAR
jgi:integrase